MSSLQVLRKDEKHLSARSNNKPTCTRTRMILTKRSSCEKIINVRLYYFEQFLKQPTTLKKREKVTAKKK